MGFFISLAFLFSMYGLTVVLIYGDGPFEIIEKFRRKMNEALPSNLGELFTCPLCLPTNLGWIFSLLDWFVFTKVRFTPFNMIFVGTNLWFLAMILDMGIVAGFCWLMHFLDEYLSSGSEVYKRIEESNRVYKDGYVDGWNDAIKGEEEEDNGK